MALTNAEKQARYRQRALRDPKGHLLTRIQVLIGPEAVAQLRAVRRRTGWTLRECVERAIGMLERDTLSRSKD